MTPGREVPASGTRRDAAPPPVQDYGHLASDYDDTRYVGESNLLKEGFRRQALTELLPSQGKRALDVACGTGRGVMILREVAPVACGVDGTREMLDVARRKIGQSRGVGVCQANAGALPFASATFDVLTCLNFLHLFDVVDQKRAFVREIGRVMKPGGVAVIEFDNALHGLALGALRKYFGRDIGYDWPWVIRSCFPDDLFAISHVRGANLPGIWRIPPLRFLEGWTGRFPLNYLATRIFIRAVRK